MFFRAVDFCAGSFLAAAVMRGRLFGVVVETLGQLAADGPDFFERFVTVRFHHLAP